MTGEDLCYLSGREALALFKARKLSPVELLKAQIARAEIVEPVINAFADTYFDDALGQARKAEAKYMKTDGRPRALEGLPLAVKDEAEIKGRRTTSGSLLYKDHIGTYTNPTIERLMRAGAIVHARTTTPEFVCAWVCQSRLFGVTRSPWKPALTCGGSSGGSAASLASGTATLATGSDLGGSIRIPAAACGVVGYKPPYGRNPDRPPLNLDSYSHIGPLARTVADCAMMQNVTAGPHPHDIATLRSKARITLEPKGIEGWKIAYSMDLGYYEIAPEVRAQVLVALEGLREAGAVVEEVAIPWTLEVDEAAKHYLDHLFGRTIARHMAEHGDLLCDYTRWYAERSDRTGAEEFLRSFETAGEMYKVMGPLLDRYHAFVCPTLASHEIPADLKPWDRVAINDQVVDTNYGWCLTHQFNTLSRLPALAVPAGIASNGLPASIQIVARSYDDTRVFRVARALEKARPWLDCAERRPSF